MNTMRFKSEYLAQTVQFLKHTRNTVNLPSDLFFEIARLMERAEDESEKLKKCFKKAYTVLAVENETVVGVASMDQDGNVGIFTTAAGEPQAKADRLLSNALVRRAEKRELPYLFVLPIDGADGLFRRLGYEPFDNGSGGADAINEYQLAKTISYKDKIDLAPAEVKRIVLDATKRIGVENKYSRLAVFIFGFACFFLCLLTVITAIVYDPAQASTFCYIWICVGLFFAAASAFLIAHAVRCARLKKKVLSMQVTNGVITSLSEENIRDLQDRTSIEYGRVTSTIVYMTYVFYDQAMHKREVKYVRRYYLSDPYFYEGQELVVAFSESESYILRQYTIAEESPALQDGSPAPESGEEPTARSEELTARKLAQYVPLRAVKWYYAKALVFSIFLLFALTVGVVMIVLPGIRTTFPLVPALFIGTSVLVLGVPGLYCILIPVRANRKYMNLLRQPDAKLTEGKLVFSEKTYKAGNRFRFYCEYTDGSEIKRARVPSRFASNMVKYGNSSVKVVYCQAESCVLVRRNRYPDVFRT